MYNELNQKNQNLKKGDKVKILKTIKGIVVDDVRKEKNDLYRSIKTNEGLFNVFIGDLEKFI